MNELSRWYTKKARQLPWRMNSDPYRIWVSEVMLQQTQVETVLSYYDRFLRKFPSLQSLAESDEQEVLTLWSGLGYYRRAKNLRLGAQFLHHRGGAFPKTREEILEVPGIGPYTAGAILSIAFDLPEPLVDGNVQRVFSRFYGVRSPIQESKTQKMFWQKAADEVKKSKSPRIHNQALMELGSLVCKKGTPLCHMCPISQNCVAYSLGIQKSLPISKPRKSVVELHWIVIVPKLTKLGKKPLFWLKQNQDSPWWDGLWDFPRIEKPLDVSWELAENLIQHKVKQSPKLTPLNHTRHQVTHHRILLAPFIVETEPNTPDSVLKSCRNERGQWLSLEEISELPLSALAKKIFRQLPV